jgi:Reverse transcriptase (RNA-dependent DNA polymerase)
VSLLNGAFRLENLARAWRWIQSNPEASYKSYFRSHYSNFRVAEDALLDGLRERLNSGAYQPAHACKIYFPKKSGGLRPYSLLTVEDQIVYQALVNMIAEKLTPRIRERQLTEVFSHLYAGKTSIWFYRKWQNGYREMNRSAREAFSDGFQYAATFDLTAFYDSVDHKVLRHFLEELGFDMQFNKLLIQCLGQWTATQRNRRIYHGHGIPQGPLSSGLLAEVVLQHFDHGRTDRKSVRYLRYVDDMRLFARTELELRRGVAELDYLSKDVGLFPQSSKIAIRRVIDIDSELKSVSRPETRELDLDAEKVDQKALYSRIRELTPKYQVLDSTEFRFLLSRAEPSKRFDRRLIRVLERQPYFYGDILRYFRRHDQLPTTVASWLVSELKANPVYAAYVADLLETADGRLDIYDRAEVDEYVRTHWYPKKLRAADQIAALGRWGVRRKVLTANQIEWAVRHLPEWWAQSELVAALDLQSMRQSGVAQLVTERLSDSVSDVAIAAAVHLVQMSMHGIRPSIPSDLQSVAGPVLEEFGLIPSGAGRVCGVARSFERLVGKKLPRMDWASFFGKSYRVVEKHAVFCYAYSGVDVTSCVSALDVFNDWLLASLTQHDKNIGTYFAGKLGGFIGAPKSKFAQSYPAIWRLASEIHQKRKESHLSHAWEHSGNTLVKPTSFVPYKYLRRAKLLVEEAFKELSLRWAKLAPAPRAQTGRGRIRSRKESQPAGATSI